MAVNINKPLAMLLALFLGFLLAGSVSAKPPDVSQSGEKGEMVTLDFQDVELSALVKTISELTGKNFLYDSSLKGKATIISPQKMSVDEAYDLFLTVLSVKGFTVVPSGKVHKIVPVRSAKEENLPTVTRPADGEASEQFITRLIPLKNVDAEVIASTVLKPLIPKTSSVVAYAPTNTLVVTDNGANIDRLVKIIRELDISGKLGTFEVIPLREGSAEEIAEICNQMLEESQQENIQVATTAAARKRRRIAQSSGGGKILPYPRTNSLIVMATGTELATIKKWIFKLDQKREAGQSNIHIYYLENADAETLAKTMNELLSKAPSANKSNEAEQKSFLRSQDVFISADIPTNALIINAPPDDYEVIQELIRGLDIQRKQVYVEALIMELSLDATKDLGVSLQGAGDVGNDSVIFGTSNLNTGSVGLSSLTADTAGSAASLLTKSVEGLLLGGLFNPITVTGIDGTEITIPAFSALLHLSKTSGDVNILSAPRLLTSDNEEAEIVVGANVPVVTGTLTDTGSSGLAQSSTVERQDVALTLRFTPQITQGKLIRLEIYQELTDLVASTLESNNGPTWTKRLIKNTVLAEDSQTVVLGGLIGTNTQENISKVPLLGDIPVLGWLFKSKNTTEQKTNLMVFITPKIIASAGELRHITQKNQALMKRLQKGTEALEEMLILEKTPKKKPFSERSRFGRRSDK
ncbi:MAG: type II secretion system secretin GspD [Deltaproteobacteria bacterium]|nr:type II secretion system secretin GspD [Deltaproteobacteria bacterium]